MTARITQLIPADGWYAVFARSRGPSSPPATGPRGGGVRPGAGPAPEFVPLIAWALLSSHEADDLPVVGVVPVEGRQVELVASDDPGFLGYAGPGDPGIEPQSFAPEWRGLARTAISAIRGPSQGGRLVHYPSDG